MQKARMGALAYTHNRTQDPRSKINESINQRPAYSHARARKRHIPALPQGAANPASRSDAGFVTGTEMEREFGNGRRCPAATE